MSPAKNKKKFLIALTPPYLYPSPNEWRKWPVEE